VRDGLADHSRNGVVSSRFILRMRQPTVNEMCGLTQLRRLGNVRCDG
jgi:hypothetical protein